MARGVTPRDRAEWEGLGGRIRFDAKGRSVYVIRRQIDGRRFEVSTRCHTLSAALRQLSRFEAEPAAYRAGGDHLPAVYLDEDLVRDFLAWSKAKGNTARWRGQQRLYLAWWAEKLRGVDLRGADLGGTILPALRGAPARPQRIAVLKVLYTWLRRERRAISAAEDPTLDALSVPQSKPEQLRRVKAVPREHVALAIEHLGSDRWRNLLRVLAGTGMHVSELERFAASGSTEPLPRDGRAEGAEGAVVIPSTKAGEPLRVAVSREVLTAAEAVLEAGPFDRQKLAKSLKAACLAAKIPPFTAGRMRHAVATWAVNAGANVAAVSTFLGHKSPRTTRRFYATLATPAKVPTLL